MAWASGSAFASWPCCASSVTPLNFSEPGFPPLLTGLQDHRDITCSSSRRSPRRLPPRGSARTFLPSPGTWVDLSEASQRQE